MNREALLNAGYTIQAEITKLQRVLPIALAKLQTVLDQIKTRKKYNDRIRELREQLKVVNGVIWGAA